MTIVEQRTIDLLERIALALEAQEGDDAAKAKFVAANTARAEAEQKAEEAAAARKAAEDAAVKAKAAQAVADAEAAHRAATEKLAEVQANG